MEWISVDERLPEKGKTVIFWSLEFFSEPCLVQNIGYLGRDGWYEDEPEGFDMPRDHVLFWVPFPLCPPLPEKYKDAKESDFPKSGRTRYSNNKK